MEVQREVQEVCSELYSQAHGSKLRLLFRAAVYWGDRFELTSRANVVSGATLSTDLSQKSLHAEGEMHRGALDRDIAAHVLDILQKRARAFHVDKVLDCFDGVGSESELRQLCMFLGAASGGSIRLIGQMLSSLVQRRINSGRVDDMRLSHAAIKEYCIRYVDEAEDALLRSGLDSNSKSEEFLRYYEHVWEWLKGQLRSETQNCIVKKRFLLGNSTTVNHLKPFINSGLLYVWSEVAIKGRPIARAPKYVIAVNEGIRLANLSLEPSEELASLGKADPDYILAKFERLQEALDSLTPRRAR